MKSLNRIACLFVCLISLFITNCASVCHSTRQKVAVLSSPAGAQVSVNNVGQGTTPLVLNLKRKADYTVSVNMPGYLPYQTALTRKMSGAFWGNVLAGGLIGMIIDAADGAMYKIEDDKGLANKQVVNGKKMMALSYTMQADPMYQTIDQTSIPVTNGFQNKK